MKLTIEIPDAHAGDVLTYVAALLAKSIPVAESTDPAPGHPELPLMPTPQPPANVLPEPEPEPPDFTKRDLPMPDDIPELPPLPEGKARWVNRGRFRGKSIESAIGSEIRYLSTGYDWQPTYHFSCDVIHIEAI